MIARNPRDLLGRRPAKPLRPANSIGIAAKEYLSRIVGLDGHALAPETICRGDKEQLRPRRLEQTVSMEGHVVAEPFGRELNLRILSGAI